ncbi:MAG: hypothetical protein JO293_03870 [Candidatus Eremiobacteraeota bacterium]|nr:hypothetical protein [Candidatus Eremiobacteraeota bacterium]
MRMHLIFLCGTLVALLGCSQNSTAPVPAAPSNLYVADFFGGFNVYATPFSAASTPVAEQTITGGGGDAAIDANGDVFISTPSSDEMFVPPVTSASTPSLTIGPIAGALNIIGIAFSPAGGLYVADAFSSKICYFAPPFGPATPTTVFSAAPPFQPTFLTFDAAGTLYVSNFTGSSIDVFTPPFTSGINAPAAVIAIAKAKPFGVKLNAAGQLIVGLVDGELALVNPPFSSGSTPAFYVAAPTINGGIAMDVGGETIDAAGNLYVPYGSNGGANDGLNAGVGVFAPPLGASSVPLFAIRAGLTQPTGTAFGR